MPPNNLDANRLGIGIFDSGLGGLTVFRAIKEALPFEKLIYFGDTIRLPYGEKEKQSIMRYTQEISSFLLRSGIKVLVVACHTACIYSLEELQKKLPIPVIGVTASSLLALQKAPRHQNILILGTRSTIESQFYPSKILQLIPKARIQSIACPLFVSLAEDDISNQQLIEHVSESYLSPFNRQNIDLALLACTHFPLLQSSIQKKLSSSTSIIDPARLVANEVFQFLQKEHLFHPVLDKKEDQFFVSSQCESFQRRAQKILLQKEIDVQLVSFEEIESFVFT